MGLIIDNFAGGGGASTGIEMALGRNIDIAINHDPAAILMHKTNHPKTKHYCESVWEVDPIEACGGQPVDLAWFSPDCKHFSKAKGGKPVDKNIRGLAWVAVKWAKLVRPKVIILENVEEFKTWGPIKDGYPDPKRKGETFELFIQALEKQGYEVDFRELRACDYGAPTTRKRFFLIARCDGQSIVWPKPTHSDPEQIEARMGLLNPWRTAAECIDWTIPCPSIFDRKKPLAENTLKRISRGIQKFILDNPQPFIIPIGYGEREGQKPRVNNIDEPLGTIVSSAKHYLVTPFLQHYYTESQAGEVRGQRLDEPLATISTANRFGLVTASISRHTTIDKSNMVMGFLLKYYGADVGQRLTEPLHTITSKDRFGLLTIQGEDYKIIDIGMRMLQPHELFKAQGFPDSYIIDRDYTGKTYPKTKQVARVGNSVCPQLAEAIVRANVVMEESLVAV